jgi:hypothetical protein
MDIWWHRSKKNIMKIRPEGAELFHADRQTDSHGEAIAFRSFANASINSQDKQPPGLHLDFGPSDYKCVLPISTYRPSYSYVSHVVSYLLFVCVNYFSKKRNSFVLYRSRT